MPTLPISLELAIPLAVVACATLFLLVIYLRRRVDQSYYGFAWLPAFFEIFTRYRGLTGEEGPRKRRGPDMAYSAGRDPAHNNNRLQQIFIPMQPDEEEAFRAFYLHELGLMEMRAPNSHLNQDGFWAISGTRQLYFGTMPDFTHDLTALPTFSVPNWRDVSERLGHLGYETTLDHSNAYLDRLVVTDPAGNEIGLIAR